MTWLLNSHRPYIVGSPTFQSTCQACDAWNSITNWIHKLRVTKPYNIMSNFHILIFIIKLSIFFSKLEAKISCSPSFNFLELIYTNFNPWLCPHILLVSSSPALSFTLCYMSTCSFCYDSVIHHCLGNPLTTSTMTSAFVLNLNWLLPHCLLVPQCLRPKQTNLMKHLSDSNQCLNNVLFSNHQIITCLDK